MRRRVTIVLVLAAAVVGIAGVGPASATKDISVQCVRDCSPVPPKVNEVIDWLQEETTCYAQGDFCIPPA
jgi:hypothetical protein